MKGKYKIVGYLTMGLGVAIYLFFFVKNNFLKPQVSSRIVAGEESIFIFPEWKGPNGRSVVSDRPTSSWQKYHQPTAYGIGVLLTDTNSCWLGLVHGFKSRGIPFNLHTNVDEALKHEVLLVYPLISGKVLSRETLKKLAQFPVQGGTLLAVNVLGGLNDAFGLGEAEPSLKRFKIRIHDNSSPLLSEFTHPSEKEISLGNANDFKEIVSTYGYKNPQTNPLLTYETGEACLTQYYYRGKGKTFAFGLDLGEFILRSENERGYNAQRSYVNTYEPTLDVLLGIVENIYRSSASDAVLMHPVPFNKQLAVCLTHDIDFTRSIVHAVDYAKLERSKGISATYFIQTKYVKDWNDDVFFNELGVSCVRQIAAMNMEIASHSVSHSYVFSKFPVGTGEEQYPSYVPFVVDREKIRNGSILGELRVSKFLLESAVPEQKVVSFRAGHLSYPFALPQALEATGFKYSSCMTANNALTHLPFQMMYNREYNAEINAFEFPVTIEDEKTPQLDLRLPEALQLAREIGKRGGLMNVLIHTDTLDYKLRFETQFIDSLSGKAWFGTLQEYADWWSQRNEVQVSVKKKNKDYVLIILSQDPIEGLSFEIPDRWTCLSKDDNISFYKGHLIIKKFHKKIEVHFSSTSV